MAYATTNPYTNEVLQTFLDATDAEVDGALDKAHAAFLTWRTTSFDQRAKVLFKTAELARARKDELARLNTLEMGKLYPEACVGDKRMIVADAIYDEFVTALTEAVEALQPGDPMDASTTLAPVSSHSAADTIREQIRQAVEHGATAAPIGKPVPAQGAFVQPTMLTGVTSDNPVYNQEIFGPVLMLFRFSDEAEAIRLANDARFGLGASVYANNIGHACAVAEQLEAGAVSINQSTLPSPSIPFGGVKNSGYGRELGAAGNKEFTNHKVINTAPLTAA